MPGGGGGGTARCPPIPINGGRHHRGFSGDFPRNPQKTGRPVQFEITEQTRTSIPRLASEGRREEDKVPLRAASGRNPTCRHASMHGSSKLGSRAPGWTAPPNGAGRMNLQMITPKYFIPLRGFVVNLAGRARPRVRPEPGLLEGQTDAWKICSTWSNSSSRALNSGIFKGCVSHYLSRSEHRSSWVLHDK